MQTHVPHAGVFAHPARNVGSLGVQPGMLIADFGAGSGHYTLQFAQELHGSGRVYAIDVQQDLLRRIKNEADKKDLKNIEIVWGDVSRLHGTKLADRAVDLVLMSNVLFQLEDKAAALKEAWRILKPTGRLALIDWSDSLPAGRQDFARMGPPKAHVVKKDTALALAATVGFEMVKEFPAGAHHWGLVLRPVLAKPESLLVGWKSVAIRSTV